MNVLIDTNVILDILLNREPFYKDAERVLVLSERGFICSYISASSVTDIFYITRKETKSKEVARELLKNIIKILHIASVTETSIFEALELNWDDFEDSIQYISGKNISADYIVTRDPEDYTHSQIRALLPQEFINQIISQN